MRYQCSAALLPAHLRMRSIFEDSMGIDLLAAAVVLQEQQRCGTVVRPVQSDATLSGQGLTCPEACRAPRGGDTQVER